MKICIPRRRLATWCNEPYFLEAVVNSFVRVSIGQDKVTKKACYRLCQIVDVLSFPKDYKFPQQNGVRPITTNKILKVRFGNSTNSYRMIMCSDSRPTKEDMQRYVEACKKIKKNKRSDEQPNRILSSREATKILQKQRHLVNNYTYTTDDIEKSIKQNKKNGSKRMIFNIGAEKTRISTMVLSARRHLQDALADLENAKTLLEEDGDEVESMELKVEEATEAVNKAQDELETVLADQKNISSIEEGRKKKFAQSVKIQKWNNINKRAAAANQKADFEGDKYRIKKEPSAPKIKDSLENKTRFVKTDTTVGQSHQFAIDEEGLAKMGGYAGGQTAFPANGTRLPRVRKGLSFDEYQAKKAEGTL